MLVRNYCSVNMLYISGKSVEMFRGFRPMR